MKILLSDTSSIDEKLFFKYDKIYFLNKFKNKHLSNNVEYIELYKYFMKSHKRAREINKILLDRVKISISLHLSILKINDDFIFECARILEIILDLRNKYPNKKIYINTTYNDYIKYFIKLLNLHITNIVILDNRSNLMPQRIKYFLKDIVIILISLINSMLVKKSNDILKILVFYNDKISFEFFKPYLDKNTLTYPLLTNEFKYKLRYETDSYIGYRFMSLKFFFRGIKRYFINKKEIENAIKDSKIKELYLNKLFRLEIEPMTLSSLKNKFPELKYILGSFDADSNIDYTTYVLNKDYNIKTISIPHGINFKYKVNYISYGTNIYTFWSKDHLNRLENSNLLKLENTQKIITGNIVYRNTLENKIKNYFKSKNILVIGEYFPLDNYYSSPFNEKTTIRLFDTLENFVEEVNECNITIRTRLKDGYYRIARRYVSDKIKISSPEKINLIDEINKHDLVIAVFSNALHEALILEKKVIQVNFLGIENYRDLAKDKLLYYATNENELLSLLKRWYNGELKELNYKFHLEKYCNNGRFEKLKIKD